VSAEEQARRLHAKIWELREGQPDGVSLPWWRISQELGVPLDVLKEIRLAAQRLGLAVKDPSNDRVTWLPPSAGDHVR
jgi:hypothetical protein